MDKEKKANNKRLEMFDGKSPEDIFTSIYKTNHWSSSESRSGTGSTISNTIDIRRELPVIFKKYEIKSLLDIACGDFNWMKKVTNSLENYKGVDIVKDEIDLNIKKYSNDKINFECYNITNGFKFNGNDFDAVLIRDALVHFPNKYIDKFLSEIKNSGIKYLITTNFTEIDENYFLEVFGQWRPLNLTIEPFNLSPFIDTINESTAQHVFKGKGYKDKNLSIWKIKDM